MYSCAHGALDTMTSSRWRHQVKESHVTAEPGSASSPAAGISVGGLTSRIAGTPGAQDIVHGIGNISRAPVRSMSSFVISMLHLPVDSDFRCVTCGPMCRSVIGFFAHRRTHPSWWDPSRWRLSPDAPVRSMSSCSSSSPSASTSSSLLSTSLSSWSTAERWLTGWMTEWVVC